MRYRAELYFPLVSFDAHASKLFIVLSLCFYPLTADTLEKHFYLHNNSTGNLKTRRHDWSLLLAVFLDEDTRPTLLSDTQSTQVLKNRTSTIPSGYGGGWYS
ncbi:hypothetical protein SCHPADRAFT_88357 [Schizopora paradoxa]|uniref:Uncharacterized protein n=1 Tax=Schizopora paradoxa TaxID=27342 RepID=A0A0H2S4I8_9AGAM|nr:hypothetical protein SCHPADRAFT_88357 [Schizopora paradoxa]